MTGQPQAGIPEVPWYVYFFMAMADLVASYDRKRVEAGFGRILSADAQLMLEGRCELGPIRGREAVTGVLAQHGLAGVAIDLPSLPPHATRLEQDFRWAADGPVAGNIRLERSGEGIRRIAILFKSWRGSAEVPECVGLSENDALDLATNAGFQSLTLGRVYDAQIPAGGIVRQFPAGGVRLGGSGNLRRLSVVHSLGDPGVALPTLDGCSLEEAKLRLEVLGFTLKDVRVRADAAPAGTVLASEPPGGSYVARGAEVVLIVSG